MGGIAILLVLAGIAYFVFVYLNEQRHKAEGNAIDRPFDFMEYVETFTLRRVTNDEFAAAAKAGNLTANSRTSMKGDSSKIEFSGPFDAVLERVERTEEKSVYQFRFTHWPSGGKTPSMLMNILLTSVEKMFLSLDPNTQITTKKGDFKTKVSFL